MPTQLLAPIRHDPATEESSGRSPWYITKARQGAGRSHTQCTGSGSWECKQTVVGRSSLQGGTRDRERHQGAGRVLHQAHERRGRAASALPCEVAQGDTGGTQASAGPTTTDASRSWCPALDCGHLAQ